MPAPKSWPEYKVEKWWEIDPKTRKPAPYFVPHYLEHTEEGDKWRPYTITVKNEHGYDTMKARRYPTRMEAEQYIEVMIHVNKTNRKD